MSYNDVFNLEAGETACCYFCMREHCYEEYSRGEAFLAGPGHSPLDGNANYVCRNHLDGDAMLNGMPIRSTDTPT